MTDVYNVRLGLICAASWSLALICGVVAFMSSEHNVKLFTFGPLDEASFAGLRVNTWTRWLCVMSFSVVSQVVESVVASTLNPFVTNVIKDHKTTDKGPVWRAHLIVQTRAVFRWLNEIGSVYILITMQLQFIVSMMFADMVVRYVTTTNFMKNVKNMV